MLLDDSTCVSRTKEVVLGMTMVMSHSHSVITENIIGVLDEKLASFPMSVLLLNDCSCTEGRQMCVAE